MASPEHHSDMTGALDLESQDIRPNPPSPQPTFEAQRHTPRALQAWKGFSHIIRTALCTSAIRPNRVHEPALFTASKLQPKKVHAQFWEEYKDLSRRPRAPVASLFHLIVKKMVHPPNGLDTIECLPGDEMSLSDWLESVYRAVAVQSSGELILCSLTAENPKSNSGLLLSTFLCLPSQVRTRREIPRRALIYLLSRIPHWHLPPEVVPELAEANPPPEIEQYQGLPSERSTESCIRIFSEKCMSLTLRWACTAPKYKGKLDTYIWQPFRKPPPFAYVKIFVSNRGDNLSLRILLLFQNKDSRTSFQESYAETQTFAGDITWYPALDGASAIVVAYKHALRETSGFLRQASKQIMALTFESRDHPSKQKMQYLLHLKDCFKSVRADMHQNLAQLREVVEKMQAFVPEGTPVLGEQIFSKLRIDSDHILAELTKLERDTSDLEHEIQLQQGFDQNSSTLTFLAILYVPISFVTSFMGMLLTDPSVPPSSQVFSTSSNSTSSQSPNVTYNTTFSASSPGPRLWDMKMFGYLAAPLLFGTIVMPLISGTLLRFVVKTYTHLMPWWHLASAALWLLCLIYFEYIQSWVAGTLRICFNATVVAVVIYQTYRAFRRKVNRTLFSAFLVGIAVCFILDWFVKTNIPLPATAAWAVFSVVYLLKYGVGRLIRKLLRKTLRKTGRKQTAGP